VCLQRHCEERSDEAIQPRAKRANKEADVASAFFSAPTGARLDCFASLAMTTKPRRAV
jgi:hypothetical protein